MLAVMFDPNDYLKIIILIQVAYLVVGQFLLTPDFTSAWLTISSGNVTVARIDVKHGLGEMPLLVDVQVKAIDGSNKGFIFQAVGLQTRDDDVLLDYSAVVYLYNEVFVKISAPLKANNHLGSIVFTDADVNDKINGAPPYCNGPNYQKSYTAQVRVRAWKQTSLPLPDFKVTGLRIASDSSDVNKMYVEKNHGLSQHPTLVVVRTKLINNASSLHGYMSDSVGSSLVAINNLYSQTSGYIVYGVSNQTFRVWVPSNIKGCSCSYVYAGGDGHGLDGAFTTGDLEIFAWKSSTVKTAAHGRFSLASPAYENSISVKTTEDEMFIRVSVESTDSPNDGFHFIGSGSLAHVDSATAKPCSYGGLTYAYTNESVRFWEPSSGSSGSVICISDEFGGGRNSQSSRSGSMIYTTWIPDFDECTSFPCHNNGTCANGDHMYTCNCTDGWTGVNCDIDVDECVSNPCQNNGTCINGRNEYACMCRNRWTGQDCSEALAEDHSLVIGLTVGLIVPAAILLCVIAAIYMATKKKKGNQVGPTNHNMSMNEMFKVPNKGILPPIVSQQSE